MIPFILFLAASYLIGAIPTAFIAGKLAKGIDIRDHGSGNVGASNVFRVIGKGWGSAVLTFDMLKGFVPAFFFPLYYHTDSKLLGLLFGIAAVVGHNWTVFLKFKGGKGVATSAGVFLGILPKAVLGAAIVWIVTVAVTNYIAVGSMTAAFSLILFIALFYRNIPEFWLLDTVSFLMACLTVYMHRSNIDRLRKGAEHKVFKRKS
ncbi:MAG: glycerol-3-phosphate 1-O-acyltransferase PlsY [Candidatus Omnitrophica bacterium]|nr:glycerol-3-phosphate 1-O-acyltransferase PlsY [Candidatus Omnitrophota bacterium]